MTRAMTSALVLALLLVGLVYAQTIKFGGSTGGGGSSGASVSVGAYGSLPGSGGANDVYFFTDALYDYAIYDGSTWDHFAAGLELTPLVNGDYSWDNQDTASVSVSGGGVVLSTGANAGVELYVRYKTAPSTPWTITIAFFQTYGNTQQYAGLVVGDGTKYTAFYDRSNSLTVSNWNSATSFGANVRAAGDPLSDTGRSGLRWLRVADDATDLTWSTSSDGLNWVTFATQGRTAHLTSPSRIGIFLANSDGTYSTSASFLHWLEE